ncbi:MAG: OrfL2, partial [uncultured Corynebacteriales bacterium]
DTVRTAARGRVRRVRRRDGVPPTAALAPLLRPLHPGRRAGLGRVVPRVQLVRHGRLAVPAHGRPAPRPGLPYPLVGRRAGRHRRLPAVRRHRPAQAAGPAPDPVRRGPHALRLGLERRRRRAARRRGAAAVQDPGPGPGV